MAITGSPAVIVNEEDLSSYVSADSVTTGAVVGFFEWGPVESIERVTSEGSLLSKFGRPHDDNYKDWFTARNYLEYSQSLVVVRVTWDNATNAHDGKAAFEATQKAKEAGGNYTTKDILLKNYSLYEFNIAKIAKQGVRILARYPGALGNRIRVSIINRLGLDTQNKEIASNKKETVVNGATSYITRPLSDSEVAVAVFVDDEVQEYGIFSIEDGSTDITGYGNYVFKYFNNNSNWIYLIPDNLKFTTTGDDGKETVTAVNIDVVLEEGSDGAHTDSGGTAYGVYYKGWDLFANEETSDAEVQLLMQGGGNKLVGEYIINLAETRKDCLACVSPMLSQIVNVPDPVQRLITATSYSKSSYAFMDGNYKYQYDSYNDCYRWMPLNGDIAGIMAQLDTESDPWFSPGGKQIKNCVKLAFHPTKAERDLLFAYNINPVTNFRGEGNILWGDWTRVTNTAFNFVGVRRMFLYIERGIKDYAKHVMWQQNDELTETTFIQNVEPFLTNVMGRRGIQEFGVYAGSAVTSPDEMDRGIFRAKILIKPVRSIRYVVLVFSAVRSDMNIEEIVQ